MNLGKMKYFLAVQVLVTCGIVAPSRAAVNMPGSELGVNAPVSVVMSHGIVNPGISVKNVESGSGVIVTEKYVAATVTEIETMHQVSYANYVKEVGDFAGVVPDGIVTVERFVGSA
jgi:hypothetical protein